MSSELKLLENKTKQEGSENSPTNQLNLEVQDQPHSIHYILEIADT